MEDRIQKLGDAEYVHFEEVPSVVQIECPLPAGICSGHRLDFMEMLPVGGFFENQVVPALQQIIDVYRIAAFPWMRYGIPPISVETVRRAVVEILDDAGSRIGRIHYLLASTSILNRFGAGFEPVQARFEKIGALLESHESENHFASAYHLCRIQRWTEALSIASAVVDHLISRLIHKLIPVDAVATAVLNPLRIDIIFNKVLPELGMDKLSETNKDLWKEFITARRERGALAHGGFSNRNDPEQEKSIKKVLESFYGVCKWLSTQLGEEWLLDVPEVAEQLQPF